MKELLRFMIIIQELIRRLKRVEFANQKAGLRFLKSKIFLSSRCEGDMFWSALKIIAFLFG